MRRTPNQCRACDRFAVASGTCEAFPIEIPGSMLFEGADHRVPIDGDEGIRFKQGQSAEQQQAFVDWQETFG